MKKFGRVFTIAFGIMCGMSLPVVFAGFFGHGAKLHAGDHVIDYTRLSDNIKVYTQEALSYANHSNGLVNRITAGTVLDGTFSKSLDGFVVQDVEASESQIVSQEGEFNKSAFYQSWNVGEAMADISAGQRFTDEQVSANAAAMGRVSQVVDNQNNVMGAVHDVYRTGAVGIDGERQKSNAVEILSAVAAANKGKILGSKLASDIAADEALYARERKDKAESRVGAFSGYDPYKPTDFDKEHRQVYSENYGFLKFGN